MNGGLFDTEKRISGSPNGLTNGASFRHSVLLQQPHNPQPAPSPGTGTRSTQVIERLTSDNDRLRRELHAERLARKEAQEGLNTSKSIISRLQTESANLAYIHDNDTRLMEKKERKVDELRVSLESEVSRRVEAERRASEMARQLENTVTTSSREVAENRNLAKRAEAHATSLADGMRRFKDTMDDLRRQLKALEAAREEDRAKLLKLEVLCDQQRQEIERSEDAVKSMSTTMKSYKDATQSTMDGALAEARHWRAQADHHSRRMDRASEEMEETVHKMAWVMGMNRAKGQA